MSYVKVKLSMLALLATGKLQITMQAWQAEPQNDGPQGRAWSAPSQPQRHWEHQQAAPHQGSQLKDGSHIMAWPPVHHAQGAPAV